MTVENNDEGMKKYLLRGPKIPRTDDFYHIHNKFQTYHCMLWLAKFNLEMGKNPIADGNYTKEIAGGYLDDVVFPFLADIDCNKKIVFCYADEDEIRRRTIERGVERDAEKIISDEAWKDFIKKQPILPSQLGKYDHIKVDTTGQLEYQIVMEQNIRSVLDYLME